MIQVECGGRFVPATLNKNCAYLEEKTIPNRPTITKSNSPVLSRITEILKP